MRGESEVFLFFLFEVPRFEPLVRGPLDFFEWILMPGRRNPTAGLRSRDCRLEWGLARMLNF